MISLKKNGLRFFPVRDEQTVSFEYPPKRANGKNDEKEHDPEKDLRHDEAEHIAEFFPKECHRIKNARKNNEREKESAGNVQRSRASFHIAHNEEKKRKDQTRIVYPFIRYLFVHGVDNITSKSCGQRTGFRIFLPQEDPPAGGMDFRLRRLYTSHMNIKKHVTTFLTQNVHLFLLGVAGGASSVALFILSKFDVSRLNAFGPTAKVYFTGIRSGLIISTTILVGAFIIALCFKKQLALGISRFEDFYQGLTETKKNLLVLCLCFVFAFACHGGNVMNGYFNQDDFMVIAVDRTTPFVQSLFIPHGNDHTLPLFRAEMHTFDVLFGQNPLPYNLFIFILFALIPFFTYLSFKRLGLGLPSFAVFLVLFAGATGWADMIPGFYIMSIYPQSFFFFSVALWAYLSWLEVKEKKYMVFFAGALACALAIDVSGLWIIPAMLFVLGYRFWVKGDKLIPEKHQLRAFFEENRTPLVVFAEVIILFSIFLVCSLMIVKPGTFLSSLGGGDVGGPSKTESWRIIPLAENYFSLFANGVSLSLLLPKVGTLLSHPAVKNTAERYWPIAEAFVLFANALLFWAAWKYAEMKEKKFFLTLFGIMSSAIFMVILARPDHSAIPYFDYRYAGAAFYMYCLFLAISAAVFLRSRKDLAIKIIVPALIIILSAQQALSFQAVRTKEESGMRRTAIENLNNELLFRLDSLSKIKGNGPLTVPNLSGDHIFVQTMAGFHLQFFTLFWNRKTPLVLIQSPEIPQENITHIVTSVPSLRASTSPEFLNALKTSKTLQKYYFSLPVARSSGAQYPQEKQIIVREKEIDPEKMHAISFTLTTDDAPGNVEILISFKNDFGWNVPSGRVGVDDFTPFEIKNGKRVYRSNVELLQLYSYALSEKVSDIVLSVPDAKNATVSDIEFK